jgi:hypothetical protein
MTTSEGKSSKVSSLVTPTRARAVRFGEVMLVVDLVDGRQISVPIVWFPRLAEAMTEQPQELNNWRLIGDGIGIHWPGLDEHVSVENLLANRSELLTYHETPVAPRGRSGRQRNTRRLGRGTRVAASSELRDPRTGRFGVASKPAAAPPPTTS